MATLAAVALLGLCAQAGAQTTGYLYTAIDDGVAWYDVGPDSGLTYGGMVGGGPATPYGPGAVVTARTADGENLYQLADSGSGQAIYQYSASLSGALSAKSPAAVGSIPLLACCEHQMMAVVNPAAEGKEGQNAVYVLSGTDTEHAAIYIFDIDATTGALTAAGEVAVPGILFGEAFAYSGNSLVIDGSVEYEPGERDEGFQLAKVDPTSGVPGFPDNLPNAPCPPSFCDDGQLAMLNENEMLSFALVPDPNSKHPPGSMLAGVAAYDVGGGWTEQGSSASHRPGPRALTPDGHEYFGTEALELEPFESEDGEYQRSEWGDSWVEGFSPDGLSEGYFVLPEKSGIPEGILALGEGLYVSKSSYADSQFIAGAAYQLASGKPPVQVAAGELGAAMTGYLFSSPAEQKAAEEAQQEAKEKAEQEAKEKPAKEAKEKKEKEEKEAAEEEAQEEAEFKEKFKGTPEEKAKAEEKLKTEAEAKEKEATVTTGGAGGSGTGGISGLGGLPFSPPSVPGLPPGSSPILGSLGKAFTLSAGASAKLKSGAIKFSVTCGLPCTVTGAILPPGAKAARASKPKALPFKSVTLPGSATPVVVTLKFTSAQKKLAASLLRKHRPVTASITVSEGPDGAAPQSKSIKIS